MIELEIVELVERTATNRQRLREIHERPRQGSLTELALNAYTERLAFLEQERKLESDSAGRQDTENA